MMISLHGRNGVALAVPQPKEIGSEDVATRFEPLTAVTLDGDRGENRAR
jgi:hypothetical protein